MALNGTTNHYADIARAAAKAAMATLHGGDFDGAEFDANAEPIFDAIEAMIRDMLDDAEVGFSAGDFGGTDDAGDAPTNITASGGEIT